MPLYQKHLPSARRADRKQTLSLHASGYGAHVAFTPSLPSCFSRDFDCRIICMYVCYSSECICVQLALFGILISCKEASDAHINDVSICLFEFCPFVEPPISPLL